MKQVQIFQFCPHCNGKFYPNRLGQIFCSSAHGWQYRNLTRMCAEAMKLQRNLVVRNLRMLLQESLKGNSVFTAEEFNFLSFPKQHAKFVPDSGFDESNALYRFYGFGILYHEDGVIIFSPWDELNPLWNIDS